MLKSLYIENYALIDSLNIKFEAGLNVITGETGAGKSIILGALSLILGQRADSRHIKHNEKRSVIEGVFHISDYNLKPFFDERDWLFDDKECILRREIWTSGKSRAFVNDSPVLLNDLKELADKLIDIHSQHQNLALSDNLFQLKIVDALANTVKELEEYEKAYSKYIVSKKALMDLQSESQKSREEEDFLRFQYDILKEANLKVGEQEQLEIELEALTHSEEIKSALFYTTSLLLEGDNSIESQLRAVGDKLQGIERVYPKVSELTERVKSAYIDMKDVREEASRLFETIEFDQERQDFIENRLSTIYELLKKHTVTTVDDLIILENQIALQLANIESYDQQLSALEKETLANKELMLEKGKVLSEKRKSSSVSIEKQLIEKLSFLKMANTRFVCDYKEKKIPDNTGIDNLQFLFSANKNSSLQPVSDIASGGEISRLMLCLKAMITGAVALPAIIFDEIDTGTSGDVADRVGTIMKEMSSGMQVIVITHLPQIATKGDVHFKVYKEETDLEMTTNIKVLTSSEKIEEIAGMLSGAKITKEALQNARVMLGVQ